MGSPEKRAPDNTAYRPSGLAAGPDGALYVSEDFRGGRVWKIVYNGPKDLRTLAAAPEPVYAEATTTVTRDVSTLPLAPGVTREQVTLGARLFHGEVRNGTCSGCHGPNGAGGARGNDLSRGTWLWSDGSLAGIAKSIADGVREPKQTTGAMPPSGGVSLTNEELEALSAYVWAIGHRQTR